MKKVLIIENWEDRGVDIAHLVKAAGQLALMVRPYAGEPLPPPAQVDAVVISGGPMSIHDQGQPAFAFLATVIRYVDRLVDRSVPCMGICLGHQVLATVLGGHVETMATPDVGIRTIRPVGLRDQRTGRFDSFVFHRDHVVDVPPGCAPTFTSDGCIIEGFRHRTKPVEGVQFHLEVPAARAVEVLTRWRSEADGRAIVGALDSFDSGGAQVVFNNLFTNLVTLGGVA